MQPVSEPITWKVGVQTVGGGPDGRGGFASGYVVPFTLSTGQVGQVFIPFDQYRAETVKAAIAAHAAEVAAVAGLTGTVTPGA